ncbi:hypothetical protein D039_0209A, partial [Vibrio parahaemolyticus EKP-028]
MISINTIAS